MNMSNLTITSRDYYQHFNSSQDLAIIPSSQAFQRQNTPLQPVIAQNATRSQNSFQSFQSFQSLQSQRPRINKSLYYQTNTKNTHKINQRQTSHLAYKKEGSQHDWKQERIQAFQKFRKSLNHRDLQEIPKERKQQLKQTFQSLINHLS